MSEKKIKVTDKRLFTADGELREEYRDLDEGRSSTDDQASPAAERPEPEQASASAPEPSEPTPPRADSSAGSDSTDPVIDPQGAQLTFLDLMGVVAQPIALYLGDAKMPDGESVENLDLARLYIELLEVLKDKTNGNLSEREQQLLEDLLYQTRMRFVEKTKQGDNA